MAQVKNFGLGGIASDVQFGKFGGRIVFNPNGGSGNQPSFSVVDANGTDINLQGAAGVNDRDFVTVAQLNSVSAGITVKASVKAVVEIDLRIYGAVFNETGGAGGTGQFTGAPPTADGATLINGDRILVRQEGVIFSADGAVEQIEEEASRNGIYSVVNASSGIWERAQDHDEDDEVTYGNYVFCSGGITNEGQAFVLSNVLNKPVVPSPLLPPPPLLNIDPIIFVLFSSAPTYEAAPNGGLEIVNGDDFRLDIDNLATGTTLLSSTIAYGNGTIGGADSKITLENMFKAQNVVYGLSNYSATGIIVRTAEDTYTSASLEAANDNHLKGISVDNDFGATPTIKIGLDIGALSSLTALNVNDLFIVQDESTTTNKSTTLSDIRDFISGGLIIDRIEADDTSVSVIDALPDYIGRVEIKTDDSLVATFDTENGLTVDSITGTAGTVSFGTNTISATHVEADTGEFDSITAEETIGALGDITSGQNISAGAAISGLSGVFGTGGISADGNITATADISGYNASFLGSTGTNGSVTSNAFAGESGNFTEIITSKDGTFSGNVKALTFEGGTNSDFSVNADGNLWAKEGAFDGGVTGYTASFFGDGDSEPGYVDTTNVNAVTGNFSTEAVIGTAVSSGEVRSHSNQILEVKGSSSLFLDSGTGSVIVRDNNLNVAQFDANSGANTWLTFNSDTATNGPRIGTSQDSDIKFVLGTDKLVKPDNPTTYDIALRSSTNGSEEAFVTKQYVSEVVSLNTAFESYQSVTATIDLSVNGTTAIPIAVDEFLQPDSTVLRVKVNVVGSDSSAGFRVGTQTNPSRYMTEDENDPSEPGIYVSEVFDTDGAIIQLVAQVFNTAGTENAMATVSIEYRVPE